MRFSYIVVVVVPIHIFQFIFFGHHCAHYRAACTRNIILNPEIQILHRWISATKWMILLFRLLLVFVYFFPFQQNQILGRQNVCVLRFGSFVRLSVCLVSVMISFSSFSSNSFFTVISGVPFQWSRSFKLFITFQLDELSFVFSLDDTVCYVVVVVFVRTVAYKSHCESFGNTTPTYGPRYVYGMIEAINNTTQQWIMTTILWMISIVLDPSTFVVSYMYVCDRASGL